MTAKELFVDKDYNCAETVLRYANEKYQLRLDDRSIKLLSGFGGGCGCGNICGVLAASIAVLGILFVKERAHEDPAFKAMCGEFTSGFEKAMGETSCAALKPVYFREDVRCLSLIEKGIDYLDSFLEQRLQDR